MLVQDASVHTRVAKRPWFSDDYLKETYMLFIHKKTSITCMVQNSTSFEQWFVEYQHDVEKRHLSTVTRTLGLAKHRFDSSSRPLAAFFPTFEALVMTAGRIMVERPGKAEEQNAELFLRSCTVERHLTAALRLLWLAPLC